jgi:trk system potassium uptake protein
MQQLLSVAQTLGGLLMLSSTLFVLPLAWSLASGDGAHGGFLIAACAALAIGSVLWVPTRQFRRELQPRDGCLLLVVGWLMMAILAAVPLLFEIKDLSLTDAVFETMAGLTTTGATALVGLDDLPQSLNLWRHALQWYGGMAIIVLAVAILPLLGVGGMQWFKAEAPGPMKETRLTPRITQTVKYLGVLYSSITLVCMLSLHWAGMSWFDALCHAFSVMSLGGFSTHDANIAYFHSTRIEIVLIVFMMIAILGFATHYLAFRQRSLRVYVRDSEVLAVWLLILASCLMIAVYLSWRETYPDFWSALRDAGFNTVSLATSTGYRSVDYDQWPIFAPMWMLLLCCVASSAGSTGGGIKMIRALILIKQAGHELVRMVHPRAVTPLRISGQSVENKVILAVLGYMLLYGVTVVVLTFALMASGLDFISSLTGVIACLNNTGPALNSLGPMHSYQGLTDLQTWLCTIAMLAGRLELLTLFALFTPQFWRK